MKSEADSSILQEVAAYYASKLDLHGATPPGVDWKDAESHQRRHRQVLRLLDDSPDASIIDIGCGFGDFYRFLRAAGHHGRFVGYDIAPSMIAMARELHGQAADREWHVGAEPTEPGDFAVASGIFNVKGAMSNQVWTSYVKRTIDSLSRAGSLGFAFNVLSLSSDPERRRANLFYADPPEMLGYCLSRYGRSVALLQDYGLFEFTIIVRHQGRP
jgi:SAM-dependent methyltransferase